MLKMMVLMGLAGLGLETIVTGWDAGYRRQYIGKACMLWGLAYATIPLLIALVPQEWEFYQRGAVYLVVIYAFEATGNALMKWHWGFHPSEMSYRKGRHWKELVNLEPARIVCWFFAGLFLEYLSR